MPSILNNHIQKLKLAVSILLLFCCLSGTQAQDRLYEAGYIVQEGDTIRGFIKRTDEVKLSYSIDFKTSATSEASTQYTPHNLKGFGFTTDGLHFAAVDVYISHATVTIKDQRFAKKLRSGALSLYKLQLSRSEKTDILLKDYSHVYVLEKEGSFHTLTQHKIKTTNREGVNKKYIGILRAMLGDCLNSLDDVSAELPYKDQPVIQLVEQYNHCKNPTKESTTYQYQTKAWVRKGIEVMYSSTYSPLHDLLSKRYGYAAGYFWDITKPNLSRKYSERIGINYTNLHYNYWNQRSRKDIPASIHLIRIPLLIQYNMNNYQEAKLNPFLNIGLTGQFSTNQKFGYLDIIPFFTVGGGAYFGKLKLEFFIDNINFAWKSDKIFNAGIGYRLNKL
ncbi:hypothetical protein [Cesiribacter sp. SM1]|uniref:hypothetical protein n=1 Tax=Cesiribacter sp. SM1 TaxID=2861196 RepID=UPI001CD1993E|nr:hypothetical protein [Cesiribacter sp. SM1]